MDWRWIRSWKPHPGKGPWSNLPPWERPGWYFGRGWCRLWTTTPLPPVSNEDEAKYLEELRKYLTEVVLKEIDKRLEELRNREAGLK
ncbi:DUF5320 domain-containing protein [Thermosphaera chiliense]|uniref:DUF5320 domain-containing protein n=1 Tax=Thermosphaera chiliense TaxID=3402707 RepID=A0A7M1UT32_9CREN|nr:DUF5320 domain-containing protein [Thermosphaera aggregans]QOR94757.1 DUF5320 domain-containing protein [Thermosphaera aggregans]